MKMAQTKETIEQPDYNPQDHIVFAENPLIGLVVARFPKSVLSLDWCGGLGDGGEIFIGRPLLPGGVMTRVTNAEFGYASTKQEFKVLAQRFDDESKK